MSEPWTYRVYATTGRILSPLLRVWLRWRGLRGKEEPARIAERRGLSALPRPDGALIWIHAASVGETLSSLPLAERIIAAGGNVLLTTGTVTSAEMIRTRAISGLIHQYAPLDVEHWVDAFLDHWSPALALRVESEIWPATLAVSARRKVPTIIINGRLSDSAARGWQRALDLARHLFGSLTLVAAQSDEDRKRFANLGTRLVEVAGNLKMGTPPLPADPQAMATLSNVIGTRPRWLAASIHPGEEVVVAAAHIAVRQTLRNVLTVIVPRHPDRAPAMIETLTRAGLKVAARSKGDTCAADTDVLMADTMGELGLFYRLCPVAFIGKTFAVGGGQNPIEAAQLGSALVWGPDMSNFRETAARLEHAGAAVRVETPAALADAVTRLLSHQDQRDTHAARAAKIVADDANALDRTFALIRPYLAAAGIR